MSSTTVFRRRLYNKTGHGYEAGRYGEWHMDRYRRFRNDTLLRIIQDKFGTGKIRILEVGCGTGASLDFLAKSSSNYSLYGIDASDTMLRQAAIKASAVTNAPKLSIGDAASLPYSGKLFDVVYATRFIHQFTHAVKRQLKAEFERVLRPNGLLILEFYARPYHSLRYFLGASKGRPREEYLAHFPTMREVREIVDGPMSVYPLRLAGSRVVTGPLPERWARGATNLSGVFGPLFLDEYFVATTMR